jgi:hypothetical protein
VNGRRAELLIFDDPIPGPTDSQTHRDLVHAVSTWRFRWWLWRNGWRKRSYVNRAGGRTHIMVRH